MKLEGENKYTEYKQEYSKSILKTVCAFANFHDGIIYFGVKNDYTVIGINNINELKLNIENTINDAILPRPYYEFEVKKVEGLKILLLKVFKGDYTPYTYKGKSYMRRDTATVQTDPLYHQNLILDGRNIGYEDLNSEVTDLSFEYLEKQFRKQFQISALTVDLLKTLGLLHNDSYNNAAALLSDENPIKSSVVQLVAFSDSGVNRIKDRVVLKNKSVLEQFDETMSFYRKHINIGEIIESEYRKTVEDVPFIAYREAVANMLVHRDYSKDVEARIEFFSDRIEVYSPGGLPIGLTEREYLDGKISVARNKKIADIFLRLKIIEKLATGIRRIKEQYIDKNVKPEFLVSENAIVVVLPFLDKSAKKHEVNIISAELSDYENLIYTYIQNNPETKRSEIQKYIGLGKSRTVEIINRLRDLGMIIKTGSGPAVTYKINR